MIYDHTHTAEIGNIYSTIGRHVQVHNYVPTLTFWALEHVEQNSPGEDWNKFVLQWESRWIFGLKANIPPGLNEILSYQPFLEGFILGKTEHLM